MNIKICAGSAKTMLMAIGVALWKAKRFDPEKLPLCRKPLRHEKAVQGILMRTSVTDLEPTIAACLNEDEITVEGRVTPRALRSLKALGVPVTVNAPPGPASDEPRYIDMTMMVVVFAALIMGMRYIALGMHDRMLYVMAGLGYATFFIVRSFSYQWKRPRSRT